MYYEDRKEAITTSASIEDNRSANISLPIAEVHLHEDMLSEWTTKTGNGVAMTKTMRA